MPKEPSARYLDELALQKEAWGRKKVLRVLYHRWYRMIERELAPQKPVVEIGSGCGNFKGFRPQTVATDVVKAGPWIDRIVDAERLNFPSASVGNLVAIDVLHHLQRPLAFLRQAAFALVKGGRLVLCEPAITPFSWLVYRLFHHEPFDTRWDLFGLDGEAPGPDPCHTFTNMAIAQILFRKHLGRTLSCLPEFKLAHLTNFGFLLYPLTGGFSYRSLVPVAGFEVLVAMEDVITAPSASWLTGLRMLVVLERKALP